MHEKRPPLKGDPAAESVASYDNLYNYNTPKPRPCQQSPAGGKPSANTWEK